MVEILNREIDNFYDVPFIGPWPTKIGKVMKLWATPCSPSAEIWVKAFWHDVPWLVWAFIKPETKDLVLNRFGTGHHGKKRRRFQIVDKTPPRFPVPKGAVGWAVFPVIKAAERVGFYLLIVDATLDFAINWQSTAYMWEGCSVPDAHWCNGKEVEGEKIYVSGKNLAIPIWTERNQHGFFATITGMQSPAGYDTQVTAQLSYVVSQGAVANLQLYDANSGFVYDATEGRQQPDGSYNASLALRDWSATKPAHTYQVAFEAIGETHVSFQGSFIELYGNKRKGLKWDP